MAPGLLLALLFLADTALAQGPPPRIDVSPQSQVIVAGTTVNLYVAASSSTTLTYQWRRGAMDIPGATAATLVLPYVQPRQAGTYQAVVANAVGSVTSHVATVTVLSGITVVPSGSVWKYLDNGSDQGTAWRTLGFDDILWRTGPAELGYGDADEATVISYGTDPDRKHITTYFRHRFDVPNPTLLTNLVLRLLRDDGGAVYLNGTEVFRSNLPGAPGDSSLTHTTLASVQIGVPEETNIFSVAIAPTFLLPGTNLLAVEIHQGARNSTDLSFDLELMTPGLDLEELMIPQWDKSFGGVEGDSLYSLQQTAEGGFILAGVSFSPPGGNKTSPHFGGGDFWVVCLDTNGNIRWDQSFGGDAADVCWVVQQTLDRGFILGGTSSSQSGGNKTSQGFGEEDYYIVRLDAQGNKLWDRTFGGPGPDRLRSLQQTADGGFILGGSSTPSVQAGDRLAPSFGGADFWVVRVDAAGHLLWDRTFGGTNDDLLLTLQQTPDQGILLGGTSSSNASGNKTTSGFGAEDFWIVRLNLKGQKIWERTFGGTGADELTSLAQTPDGGLLLGGRSTSVPDGCKTSPNFDTNNATLSKGDFWVVRLDRAGDKLWDQSFGGPGEDSLRAIAQTTNGGFMLAGNSYSEMGGNKDSPGYGQCDFWAVRLEPNGARSWDSAVGGYGHDALYGLQQLNDGGLLYGGESASSANGWKTSAGHGSNDFWIAKVALRKARTGTPLILVNGQYAPSGLHQLTSAIPVRVQMESSFPNGSIHYSLSGMDPSSGLVYSEPFPVTKPATIRAIAYSSDGTHAAEAQPVVIRFPSTFFFLSPPWVSGARFHFHLEGSPGVYLIQSSPDLSRWDPAGLLPVTNGSATFVEPITNTERSRFYRALRQ